MTDVSFAYAPTAPPLFEHLKFDLSMDSRVALVGPNGCGKSTFLNLLAGSLSPSSGEVDQANGRLRVGVYAQHLVDSLPGGLSPVEHLHALMRAPVDKAAPTYQQVRHELGSKGLPSYAHELRICDLSGGQKARVAFAAIAAMQPHVMLLDEPTNHLDIESIDALISAINAFDGGVVAISHDRRLLQRTNCQLWQCAGGGGGGGIQPLGADFSFEAYEARVLKQIEKRQQAEEQKARQREALRVKRKEEAVRNAKKRADAKKKG